MKKQGFALVLAMTLLLSGCGKAPSLRPQNQQNPNAEAATTEATTVPTVPPTIPENGNPNDVTCLGSYTGQVNEQVIAQVGEKGLSNEALQVWYWAEVAQYRQENHGETPDFDKPLDMQECPIDLSVNSWQQYFLKKALTAWHQSQALILTSREVPLTQEEAYQPKQENHEHYMTDMPATKVLYGYNPYYSPNSMHQAYLDSLPETLDALAQEKGYSDAAHMASFAFCTNKKSLTAFAQDANLSYMYFTHMSHYIEPTQEELDAYIQENQGRFSQQGKTVDIRQVLLVPDDVLEQPESPWAPPLENPAVLEKVEVREDGTVVCSEQPWSNALAEAEALLTEWKKETWNVKPTEATFADMANKHSDDLGTRLDGGAYYGITQGRLPGAVDEWCFAPERQAGDTAIIRSDYGVHMVYMVRTVDTSAALAEEDYYRQQQKAILASACEAYPMEVTYDAIILGTAEGTVSFSELLYPDVAHERFPEIPLYLQQDYPTTMYGYFPIITNGCGITSLAMLASYMADDELTPPELCARYGNYSHVNGTDGMIFNYEPAVMGFYLREKTYDHRVAWDALMEGQIVISVQSEGYWTGGGHYIVVEKGYEDGTVQVRDSNIFNYKKLTRHLEDRHKWSTVTSSSGGFWIYEDKVTYIPACTRCGTDVSSHLLDGDYTCHKCTTALLRRNTYLGS